MALICAANAQKYSASEDCHADSEPDYVRLSTFEPYHRASAGVLRALRRGLSQCLIVASYGGPPCQLLYRRQSSSEKVPWDKVCYSARDSFGVSFDYFGIRC